VVAQIPTTALGPLLPAAESVTIIAAGEVSSVIRVQLALLIWGPFKAVFLFAEETEMEIGKKR